MVNMNWLRLSNEFKIDLGIITSGGTIAVMKDTVNYFK